MYRHSIFFATLAEADAAETWIHEHMQGIVETYQSNDGESGDSEVGFFTDGKLSERNMDDLFRSWLVASCADFALNCDDGD